MPISDETLFSTISYMRGEIQALTAVMQATVCMLPDLEGLLAVYDRIEQNGLARVEALQIGDEAVGAFRHMMSVTRSLAQQTLEARHR